MDAPEQKKGFAWQPFTPKGVSLFARASWGRLLLVQFLFAVGIAGAVIWFIHEDWFPVAERAINHLPQAAEIRRGRLQWGGESPAVLAEGRFLAISVDLRHEGQARSPAHVTLELGELDYKVYWLPGCERVRYPNGWTIFLTHNEAGPWWGAWSPAILAGAGLIVVSGLMIFWTLLASIYCGPGWLLGVFANRDLKFTGSWRLSGAALMPGVLLLLGAIFCYGLGWLDLVRLALAAAIHLAIGWVYVVLSILKLPRHAEAAAAGANPFAESKVSEPVVSPPAKGTNRTGH